MVGRLERTVDSVLLMQLQVHGSFHMYSVLHIKSVEEVEHQYAQASHHVRLGRSANVIPRCSWEVSRLMGSASWVPSTFGGSGSPVVCVPS